MTQHSSPKAGRDKLYILAASALLGNPVMLAHASTRSLVIPSAVKAEISARLRGQGGQDILTVIDSVKNVEIADAPPTDSQSRGVWNLGNADAAVARIAVDRSGSDKFMVVVVTQNAELQRLLKGLGIASQTSREVLKEWSADLLDTGIQKSANAFASQQLALVVGSVTGGIVVAVLAIFAFHFRSYFIATFTLGGAVLLICSFSFILFWFRQKHRIPYGIAEWIVGAGMTIYALYFTMSSGIVVQGIQILGGLYAMVRGLDNLGKGLQRTKFGELWEKIFKETL